MMSIPTPEEVDRRNAVHRQNVAINFMAPGLPTSLLYIGILLGLDREDGEDIADFAKRIIERMAVLDVGFDKHGTPLPKR